MLTLEFWWQTGNEWQIPEKNDDEEEGKKKKNLFSFSFLRPGFLFLFYRELFCCVFFSTRKEKNNVVGDSPPVAQHVIYQISRYWSIIRLLSTIDHISASGMLNPTVISFFHHSSLRD